MKLHSLILASSAISLLGATSARASQIEVLQGASLGSLTSLGTFDAYSGTLSAVANFNWASFYAAPISGPPGPTSAGGSSVPGANEEQIFFYVDGSGNLSFNTIFRNGDQGGGQMSWDIEIDSAGDQSVLFSDDAGEVTEAAPTGTTENFQGRWRWASTLTDGGVIGNLTGDWEVRIDPISYNSGSESLQVYDGSDDSSIPVARNTTEWIVFRPASVPDAGSTVLLLLLGIAGLLGGSKFRRGH